MILSHLAPIQTGEKSAGEILAVDRAVADQYFAEGDQAVAMAEFMMVQPTEGRKRHGLNFRNGGQRCRKLRDRLRAVVGYAWVSL